MTQARSMRVVFAAAELYPQIESREHALAL